MIKQHPQEWGHNFREEYRRLGSFRDRFPDVPIMALTASATAASVNIFSCAKTAIYSRFPLCPLSVQDDIIQSLKMSQKDLFKVVHPFNRENLFYEVSAYTHLSLVVSNFLQRHLEVRYTSSSCAETQMADIHSYIAVLHARRRRPSSGIIYCRTRATCDELSHYLRGKGMNARPYHRGIKYVITHFLSPPYAILPVSQAYSTR